MGLSGAFYIHTNIYPLVFHVTTIHLNLFAAKFEVIYILKLLFISYKSTISINCVQNDFREDETTSIVFIGKKENGVMFYFSLNKYIGIKAGGKM